MGRQPCFIPENKGGVLVELTGRTIGARSLLVPSPNPRLFNEMVVGVLGRAREVSPVELCSVVVTANHWHALAVVHDQQQLSRFMHHFCGNLTKEVNRLRGRRGPLWARRYDRIVVSDEPEVQWDRLKYHLSHGVKEGLTESPLDWPGVHAARALVHGEKLEGFWFNRAREWAARNRGLEVGTYDFATKYLVGLAPLPAFRHLTSEEYQAKVAELIHEIEEEGKTKHPMADPDRRASDSNSCTSLPKATAWHSLASPGGKPAVAFPLVESAPASPSSPIPSTTSPSASPIASRTAT
jgi:REP element-mobilizing transposase RayT